MKHILITISCVLLLFSCEKASVEPLFDSSANARADKTIKDYKATLVGAASGWRGAYYPNGAQDGGYTFYLKFADNGNLTMYSDLALDFTDQAFETTFQVKALQKPTLIFDTYSYLHELVNPDYNGGEGALADLELTIESITADKVILKGIRNSTYLELTKLSAADYESLTKGGLANIVRSTINYIRGEKFIYLNGQNGEKADIFIDYNTKQFILYFVNNGQVETQNMAFVTTTNGITFKEPIKVFGNTISELIWDNTRKQYYYNSGSQRVNLSEGNKPALPFYYALGSLFNEIHFDPAINTQSSVYKNLFTTIKNKTISLSTAAPVRVIDDVYMIYFEGDQLFALVSNYTRTYADRVDTFGAVVLYEPSLDAKGNIVFSRLSDTYTLVDGQFFSGASAIVLEGIKDFTNVLESQSFAWDYDNVESKTANLVSASNPAIFIKGKLL